jgi:glycosyltransferase involved in cell wall biosynthesis
VTGRTILFGVGYYQRLNGAQKSLLGLLVGLRERGHRPVVMFTGEGRCTAAYRDAGIEVAILRVPEEFNAFNKAWLGSGVVWRSRALATGIPSITRQVWGIARRKRVDLVHLNEPRALLLFGWGAVAARVPIVLHVRGALAPYPRPLRALLGMLPQRLIVVGETLVDSLEPRARSKARVVHNAVEVPSRSDPANEDAPPLVLTMASFDPYKGYHHLAEAVAQVNARLGVGAARFVWLGDTISGTYEGFVRKRVRDLALPNVEILGWQEDPGGYLDRAAVVVLPTVDRDTLRLDGVDITFRSAEGVPRCLLEASAHGKPTIGTRVGGIPEAVHDGINGVLVNPADPAALASAIVDLLRSPERRAELGAAGRALVLARFTRDRLVDQILGIYDELAPISA